MRKELDDLLCKKYPEIFQDRYAHCSKTAMCWGFECDDGWFDLIDITCALINRRLINNQKNIEYAEKWNKNVLDKSIIEWEAFSPREIRNVPNSIEPVIAVQVKEKFGTLRFYYLGGNDFIRGVVSMAEDMSSRICERCGTSGKIRDGRWIKTLCDDHAKELGYIVSE